MSMPTTPPGASWGALRDEVVSRALALPDGATLTVDAPDLARPMSPRAGIVGRLFGARHALVAPWVRLQRQGDHIRGETVRGAASRGRFPMSRVEVDAVRALGWHETRIEESENFVRWWPDDVADAPYLPESTAQQAAEAAVRVLVEIYGAATAQVRLTTSTGSA